jgi:PAS domain S-box-containing protein
LALLVGTYRAQEQLRVETELRQINDNRRRAAAIADLISQFRLGVATLAEAPEVSNYLTNKGLGMSLRYGLATNLYDIKERFVRQIRDITHHDRPIYSRIVYIDDSGKPVVDTQAGAPAIPPPKSPLRQLTVDIKPGDQRILISAPVHFKERPGGTIVAIVSLDALTRDLVSPEGDARYQEILTDSSGFSLRAPGSKYSFSTGDAAMAKQIPPDALVQIDLPDRSASSQRWQAIRSPVPSTDLSLITLLAQTGAFGQNSSQLFLYGAGVVPVVVLILALLFQRMRRVETALLESRRHFKAVVDHISDAILLLSLDGRLIDANPRTTAVYGYTRNELLQLDIATLGDGSSEWTAERWREQIRNASNGGLTQFEWRTRSKDGQAIWLEVSMLKAFIGGNNRILVVEHDITKRKAQERELQDAIDYQRQLNKKLEEAKIQLLQSEKMASIGQLAAGVAHEINNPMGYINSNVGTLENYVNDAIRLIDCYQATCDSATVPADRVAPLDAIKEQIDLAYIREDLPGLIRETKVGVERVQKIVQDLKSFSHIDNTEWTQANLHDGIESTLNVVWSRIKHKAEVVREYGDIPKIWCLPGQVNQVVMNLLLNAADAIDQHGKIFVRTGREGEMVWIEIEDTGCGIAPEHIKKIFDPFFTTRQVGQGTGLGLSLAYGIIEQHHGRIDVSSKVGRGSRFRIWLPIASPRDSGTR